MPQKEESENRNQKPEEGFWFWARDAGEARALQRSLADRVRTVPLAAEPRFVAGADAAFLDGWVLAAACLFTWPKMELVETSRAVLKVRFPYVPGLLSFREGPAVVRAVMNLKRRPDLLFLDGQGIAHPVGIGLASHVGLALDIATIGCAKSRLVGEYREPGRQRGGSAPLVYKGRQVGSVLRTRDEVRPVFISPGHMIDFEDSMRMALSCLKGFRIPEPTRAADMETKRLKIFFKKRRRGQGTDRYTGAVCKKHCPHFGPEKSKKKCGAFLFLSRALTAGEIEDARPAVNATFGEDEGVMELACRGCHFLKRWCPYRTKGEKPCGGYLVIEGLISR